MKTCFISIITAIICVIVLQFVAKKCDLIKDNNTQDTKVESAIVDKKYFKKSKVLYIKDSDVYVAIFEYEGNEFMVSSHGSIFYLTENDGSYFDEEY